MNRVLAVCAITAFLFSDDANAHHGLDFVLVQTAHLPLQGVGYAIGRLDYISEDEDEMEFEPALLYGAADWLTVELHGHFEKAQGESIQYESLAPALHFRLTPPMQVLEPELTVGRTGRSARRSFGNSNKER